jgi:hypothetical protein
MGSPNKPHPATFTTTGRTWICPSAIALQSLFPGTWLTSTEGHGTASSASRFTVERLAGLAVLDPGAAAPIELSGFGLDEIDQLVIGEDGENTEVGDLSPPPGEAPVTRIGDLFHLGSHRVICADSTDPAIVSRLMLCS